MAFTYTPPKILSDFQKQNIPQWKKDLLAVQGAYQAPTTTPTLPAGGASMITPPNAPVQPKIAPTAPITAQPTITPPSAVLGATAGAVTPPIPTPTKDINLTVPQVVSSDIIAGAPTSGQVLTKAKSLADQYQEFLTQQQAQQQASIQAQTPTAQEQALTQQMNTLNQQANEAIAKAEESGVTGRFAAGETARTQRQATIQMQGLSDQLNALTAQRSVQIDAITSQMDFNKENMDAITNLAKLSQPDVISTGIDKKTGEIYSLVKDPQTGEITQNIVGKVTPELAQLKPLDVFVDNNGNRVASFLGEDNKIINQVLGKAQVKAGEGGVALAGTPQAELAQAQVQSNISEIDALKTAKGMSKAVGATFLARWTPFKVDVMTGEKANFIAGVEQMVSGLSLDALINAKSRGATFGALSEGEMKILSASASKIGTWRKLDGDGNVVGYSASEKAFKKELDRISNFAKLDYVLKGGDPSFVDVIVTPDGKLHASNSDGSITELR